MRPIVLSLEPPLNFGDMSRSGQPARTRRDWPASTFPLKGEYELHATAKSLQKSLTFHWLSPSSRGIEIRLRPGGEVRGTLTDSQGRPVSGVEVRAITVAVPTVQCDAVKSDEQGKYLVRGVPTDQPIDMRVSKSPDYERVLETNFALNGAPYRPLDFRLEARATGGNVEVQVVDPEGRPIPKARIANHGGNSADVLSASTDDEGRCALESLHLQYGNRCELVAQADGFCPQVVKVPPAAGRKPALKITLQPGHRLQGRVITRDGMPVSDAIVEYGDRNFEFGRIGGRIGSDQHGRFDSKSLPARFPIRVRADGFDEWSQNEIAADGSAIEIVLVPAGPISGAVIDSRSRKPVHRFNVKLRYAERQSSDKKDWARIPENWTFAGREYSSSTGQFIWPELQSDMDYEVCISADGYEPQRKAGFRPGRSDAVIALKPVDPDRLVAVGGRVLDPAGQPVEGVFVNLISFDQKRFPEGSRWSEFPMDFIKDFSAARQAACRFSQIRVTSPDGRFEFQKVPIAEQTELVYWGEDTAPERVKQLQLMDPLRLKEFVFVAPLTAKITGSIDTTVFPNPSKIWANIYSGPSQFFHGKIRQADGKVTYTISGLPEDRLAVRLFKPALAREDGTVYRGTYLDILVDTTKQRVVNFDFDEAAKAKAIR
jgi:protocatechuate 3,4-dioxygenase beta subunit